MRTIFKIAFTISFNFIFWGCDDIQGSLNNKIELSENSDTTTKAKDDAIKDISTEKKLAKPNVEVIKKDVINYPAISKEEKVDRKTADGAGGYLDRSDRSDCEIFKFTFSDGSTGTLVLRDDTWFSYSVRGKKREKPFASKEDGLQEIWETSQKLEKFGAGIGAAMSKKGVPLKKDGTPDKRYSVNK